MEAVAWFSHKYIMHGFYGPFTKTITTKIMTPILRETMLFYSFAAVSAGFVILWESLDFGLEWQLL